MPKRPVESPGADPSLAGDGAPKEHESAVTDQPADTAAEPTAPSSPLPVGLPEGFTAKMPDVQPNAVAAVRASRGGESAAGDRDRAGGLFDPAIHATDKDGKPKKTKDGNFAKKKGRKPGNLKIPAKAGARVESVENYAATAQTAAGFYFGLGMMALGDDFRPVKTSTYDEQLYVAKAFEDYFRAQEIKDFPPNVALAIALSAPILSRIHKPSVKERAGGLFAWIKSKAVDFAAWRKKRQMASKPGKVAKRAETGKAGGDGA